MNRKLNTMQASLLILLVLAGCAGSQSPGSRSASIRMQGPNCRMACLAQVHPGEVLIDCTPPLDFEPKRRDPGMTACFFGPAK